MSYAGTLQPGTELGGSNNDKKAFESPYSSFAISIDTRNIESSHVPPGDKSARKPKSALKHHQKARSASDELQSTTFSAYGCNNEKKLNGLLASRDDEKHSVRFGAMPGLNHHRRSSTAAFLDYINRHLPENSRHQPPMLTLKRAFLMFCIVFSATYLAMSLLPGSAVWSKDVRQPDAYFVKRGAGYYGNSNIFQSGEVIKDQADEHSLYLVHVRQPSKNGKIDRMPSIASPKVIPGELEPVATRDSTADFNTVPQAVTESTRIAEEDSVYVAKVDNAEMPSRLKAVKDDKVIGAKEPLYDARPASKIMSDEEEEDVEIEKKIAELKHRKASRQRAQKKGPARQAAQEAVAAPLESEEVRKVMADPRVIVQHPPKVGKDALRKVAAIRRKDSAYDTPLRVQ